MAADDGVEAIVARNVSKMFLDGAVTAFRALDLGVREKETLCIVGPSGCGKTTFLRCVAGLTEITGGELMVGGKTVAGPGPPASRWCFSISAFCRGRTVYHNAAFGLALAHAPAAHIRERVGHYLELVGLNGFEAHYPHQLSGGMQQRVGLVRALAINPDILLMDEPFAALDAQTREVLQEELLRIMQDGARQWCSSRIRSTRRFCSAIASP